MQRLMRLTAVLGALLFALMALLTFIDVVGRYVFARTLPGGYDLSQQLQAIVIFWGMALATYDRSHIGVDILWERLRPAAQQRMDKVSDIVCALAFAAIFVCSALQVPKMIRSSEIIPDLGVALWVFSVVALLGIALAVVGALLAASAARARISDAEGAP